MEKVIFLTIQAHQQQTRMDTSITELGKLLEKVRENLVHGWLDESSA